MAVDADYEPADRRPIASRNLSWVRGSATRLAERGVSPNHISASSMVFAAGAAAAILATEWTGGVSARLLWIGGAVLVQLRLLANLFDGMVAMQSKRASPLGELFNEVPDRVSDALILIALGFVTGSSVHLGLSAALLAVFVSYVRAMGGVAGAGQVFGGAMAKPQRMFLVTLLSLFQALAPEAWRGPWESLRGIGAPGSVLVVICLGCLVTSWTRLAAIARKLGRET